MEKTAITALNPVEHRLALTLNILVLDTKFDLHKKKKLGNIDFHNKRYSVKSIRVIHV